MNLMRKIDVQTEETAGGFTAQHTATEVRQKPFFSFDDFGATLF